MFYYKYKRLSILAGLVLALLSFGALGNGTEKTVIKDYSTAEFSDTGDWRQRIIGWRAQWTCVNPASCNLSIVLMDGMSLWLACPNGAQVLMHHQNLIIPPACFSDSL